MREVETYVEAETAGEFEGEVDGGVCGVVRLFRVVHEDWEELVAADGVEGEEGVDDEVDVRLAGEDFSVAWRRLTWGVVAVFVLLVFESG